MTEAQKKRKNFMFFGKRPMSVNIPSSTSMEDPMPSPTAVQTPAVETSPSINSKTSAPIQLRIKSMASKDRGVSMLNRSSMGAIEDLVQCPLCLEKLNTPKMLACQHTFCLHCLETQVKDNILYCPSCQSAYPVTSTKFLETLPSNLYIDNLLKLLISPTTPTSDRPVTFAAPSPVAIVQKRCSKCQSLLQIADEQSCNHCKQSFCGVCWSAHISDLKSQISSLLKQLEVASTRLNHRLTDYKDRHESLIDKINASIDKKIQEISLEREKLLSEADKLMENGNAAAEKLQKQLRATQDNVKHCISSNFDAVTADKDKVAMFMNYHRMTIDVLNEVSHFGEIKFVFDQENFKIDDESVLADAEGDDQVTVEVKGIQNPLENSEVLTIYYRSRHFNPRSSWKKCQRPAGVAVGPWDNNENIYICTMESQHILVIDKHKGKVVQRITDTNMICPHSIAFSQARKEIYVTDKWNHSVHVISKDGKYLRSIGSKGKKDGFFLSPEGIAVDDSENFLYVCDTGNDRVQVFSIDTGAFVRLIGIVNEKGTNVRIAQLNGPTGIAMAKDKVVIVDSGNRKIKTYSLLGEKINEFGSFGSHKGQFRHPESVTVDPLGFILVGDSGNARVQIFKPNGTLVRVFGGKGQVADKFGWISGIHVTPQLEIIISDPRKHQIYVY